MPTAGFLSVVLDHSHEDFVHYAFVQMRTQHHRQRMPVFTPSNVALSILRLFVRRNHECNFVAGESMPFCFECLGHSIHFTCIQQPTFCKQANNNKLTRYAFPYFSVSFQLMFMMVAALLTSYPSEPVRSSIDSLHAAHVYVTHCLCCCVSSFISCLCSFSKSRMVRRIIARSFLLCLCEYRILFWSCSISVSNCAIICSCSFSAWLRLGVAIL